MWHRSISYFVDFRFQFQTMCSGQKTGPNWIAFWVQFSRLFFHPPRLLPILVRLSARGRKNYIWCAGVGCAWPFDKALCMLFAIHSKTPDWLILTSILYVLRSHAHHSCSVFVCPSIKVNNFDPKIIHQPWKLNVLVQQEIMIKHKNKQLRSVNMLCLWCVCVCAWPPLFLSLFLSLIGSVSNSCKKIKHVRIYLHLAVGTK